MCVNVWKGTSAEWIQEVLHVGCSVKLGSFSLQLLVGVRCSDASSVGYCYRCGHCRNLVPDWKKAATALKVNMMSTLVLEL